MSGLKTLFSYAAVKKFRNAAIVLIALLISIIGHWELKIPADFKILAEDEITVKAETTGVLVEVLARENMHVKKGDLLARTRDFERQAELDNTSGELQQKKHELELLENGTLPALIVQQESRIATKRVEIANSGRILEQRKRLQEILAQKQAQLDFLKEGATAARKMYDEGIYPKIRLDEALSLVDVKQKEILQTEAEIRVIEEGEVRDTDLHTNELKVLENELAVMRLGNRKELIDGKKSEIDKLNAMLSTLNKEIGKGEIRAPIDGVVATPFPERQKNQRLAAGQEFIRLVNTSGVIAEMLVPEKELAEVKPGNVVWLKVRSLPRADFEGRVDFIASVVHTVDGQQMVVVRTQQFPNDNDQLKPEMTGVALIYCGERRIIDIATRRMRGWFRTEFQHYLP